VARLLAEQMDRAQARTVIIDNRPGAGSSKLFVDSKI
jgi:hypothetical protein